MVGLWAVVKFPSVGDPMIQERSPWTASSGTGLYSEILAFEVMVTEMVAFQALHWGKASWILSWCSSYGRGSSWLYLICFPTSSQTSQLLLLLWEAFVLWQRKPYKVDEQRDDCICIAQPHPFLLQYSASQGHFK